MEGKTIKTTPKIWFTIKYILLLTILGLIVWNGYFAWQAKSQVKYLNLEKNQLVTAVYASNWQKISSSLVNLGNSLNLLNKNLDKIIGLKYLDTYNSKLSALQSFVDNYPRLLSLSNKLIQDLDTDIPYKLRNDDQRDQLWSDLSLLADSVNRQQSNLLTLGVVGNKQLSMLSSLGEIKDLAGIDKPVKLLIIFQDEAELRPTGGFWGTYAMLTVSHGIVSSSSSYNVIDITQTTDNRTIIPEDIRHLIETVMKVPTPVYFGNSISDFDEVAKILTPIYGLHHQVDFDAAIAIDIAGIGKILDLVGSVSIPSIGKVDSNNITQKLVYDRYSKDSQTGTIDQTKSLVGRVGVEITNKLMSAPGNEIIKWIQDAIANRHLLAYSPKPRLENTFIDLGIGGSFKPKSPNYIHLEEFNFGGKQSLFLSRLVNVQKIGPLSYKVKLTYKYEDNPIARNLELTEIKNLIRLRLPDGATIDKVEGGYQNPSNKMNILSSSAVSNVLLLHPGETKEISFEYTLPATFSKVIRDYPKPVFSYQPGISTTSIKID